MSVGGVSLTRDTDGGRELGPGDEAVGERGILIAPNATNEVGQPHTFTVTLVKDTGAVGFVPAVRVST